MLAAEDLPALLAAAYRGFDCALQALRGAEDQAGPLLPAFVLAAAAAADGRDAVAAARSFPGPGSPLAGTAEQGADVLDALASYYQQHGGRISQLLRSPEIAAEFDNWHS